VRPFFFALLALATLHVPSLSQPHHWHPSHTGGGGYITGLLLHPQNANVLYARCDVAGVFRSTNGGQSWQTLNGGLTDWYTHSVQSFAISPHHPAILFRCSGDKRNGRLVGSIHKSSDAGKTWREVNNQAAFFGNGPTRFYGEVIALDPFEPNTALVGTYQTGIFRSTDEGETWHKTGFEGERFIHLSFHPYQRGWVFGATKEGSLLRSTNSGQTWQRIRTDADNGFSEIAYDPAAPKHLVAAGSSHGIWISTTGGDSFQPAQGLPTGVHFNTVVQNGQGVYFTAPDARPGHALAAIPLYKSTDGGRHWALIRSHTLEHIRNRPACIKQSSWAGWAISKIRTDTTNPDRLFYTNWYGVYTSSDGGQTWDCHQFEGLETNCLENIQVHPIHPGRVCYTVADHTPAISVDSGQSFRLPYLVDGYSSSTAAVVARQDTGLVLFGMRSNAKSALVKAVNGVPRVVRQWSRGQFVQAIQEDPHQPGRFYAFVDGIVADSAGLYRSDDRGETWQLLPNPFPPTIPQLPYRKAFIENELMNIVVGQVKNVCGTNQLLTLDPHQANIIYIGEWTEGVYRSMDGGQNWQAIGRTLPFHRDTASVLTVLKADPYTPGVLYAGFIREGLWKSTDQGQTWRKLFPTDGSVQNVSALTIAPNRLVIGGEPLYWGSRSPLLMQSMDAGQHWQNLYDPAVGALRIKALAVNPQTGRIHVATSGNGAFYID